MGVMSTPSITISSVTFDCGDALAAATFWSTLLDLSIDEGGSTEFASMQGGPVALSFTAVPEAKGPKNRVHLDLAVSSLPDAKKRAVQLGATLVGDFDGWSVLTDPFGNEFCLVG